MNIELLKKHLASYRTRLAAANSKESADIAERQERSAYYQQWTRDKLQKMQENDFQIYIGKLWAMQLWSNKRYATILRGVKSY